MRNLYTQILLAAVLASGTARNITLERRASVEIGGVTHEVAASVEIPIDDVEDPHAGETSSLETSTTTTYFTDNHSGVFPSGYERGVCQNILYDYTETMTEVGREVRKTARACYDDCVSQGGRLIDRRSLSTATTPMGGYISQ